MAEQGGRRVNGQVEETTSGAGIDIQRQHRDERQRDSSTRDAEIQILKVRQIDRTDALRKCNQIEMPEKSASITSPKRAIRSRYPCNRTTASFVFSGEYIFGVLKMNSNFPSRIATIAFAAAFALVAMTGCFGSPRANDTFAGAAIGAGGGALIGSAAGHPAAGALIGGVGGGALGYVVGSETERYYRYPGGGGGDSPYRDNPAAT